MLVFTRAVGETFYIGDVVSVTIMKVNKRQVSIAINAPKAIPVHREEIYERIKRGDKLDRGSR